MRLEGVAPFGPPAFVLAARPGAAVLLLPRDERVVRHPEARDVLGALTGVPLAPADLLAVLTGLRGAGPDAGGRPAPRARVGLDRPRRRGHGVPAAGRTVPGRCGRRAARRGRSSTDQWQGGLPRLVRLRSLEGQAPVDATVQVSQIETNVDVPATAFTVEVPADMAELTLEELRQAGPLRTDNDARRGLAAAHRRPRRGRSAPPWCRMVGQLTPASAAAAPVWRHDVVRSLSARPRGVHAGPGVSRRLPVREHGAERPVVAAPRGAGDGPRACSACRWIAATSPRAWRRGDRNLVQLTWETGVGFVYDRASFKLLRTFTYAGEGWGLADDGSQLVMSDGTPTLRFLDPVDVRGDAPRDGARRRRARSTS